MRVGKLYPYMFLLPTLLILVILWAYPLFELIYLSFYNLSMITPFAELKFVGFRNYLTFLNSAEAVSVTIVTIKIILLTMSLSLSVAMVTALTMKRFANRFVRSVIVAPYAIPTVVTSMVFLWMLQPTSGVLSYLLYLLTGIRADTFSDPLMALIGVSLAFVWKYYPFSTLILLAAFESVPQELYEAADLDGASEPQGFLHITLPSIRAPLGLLILILFINGFQCFDVIYIMTAGGPGLATENMVIYLYHTAFVSFKTSYSSAIAVITTAVMFLAALLYLHFARLD